jgi:hypothetical protein
MRRLSNRHDARPVEIAGLGVNRVDSGLGWCSLDGIAPPLAVGNSAAAE